MVIVEVKHLRRRLRVFPSHSTGFGVSLIHTPGPDLAPLVGPSDEERRRRTFDNPLTFSLTAKT